MDLVRVIQLAGESFSYLQDPSQETDIIWQRLDGVFFINNEGTHRIVDGSFKVHGHNLLASGIANGSNIPIEYLDKGQVKD